jgi:predicted enzyme related to lactoylglutathione lyase
LQEAGVAVLRADDAEIPGQRRFHVSDPWGNRLELVAAV